MSVHDSAPEGRGRNFYRDDKALQAILDRLLDSRERGAAEPLLQRMGELAGGEIDRQAEYTDRQARPVLETYNRQGDVVNHVLYNPLYEESARHVYGLGIVGCNYGADRLRYAVHYALLYLLSESDPGLACPVTLTAATAFALDRHGSDAQKRRWMPGLTVRQPGPYIDGATWVTEKQGGSDAGAATTAVVPGERPGHYRLSGEKWFASNADADLALVTARPEGATGGTNGLGLYLFARRLDDGSMNHYRIRRLKDKLGTTGLATGEVELDGAVVEEITPPPYGFKHMLDALEFSRIGNAAASAGIMRRVLTEASLYAGHRDAFGQSLDRFPMVQETLATMLAELEGGLELTFEAVHALDEAVSDNHEKHAGWQRLMTALAKYRTGEDAVRNASRAIEILGGNGYVEEYVTARMYREAQVLPVWEGTADIQALEVVRLIGSRYRVDREFLARVGSVAARAVNTAAEVSAADGGGEALRGVGRLLHSQLAELEEALTWLDEHPEQVERHARRLTDWMADLIEVALLAEKALPELATGSQRTLAVAWWLAQARLTPLPLRGVGDELTWLPAALPAMLAHEPVTGLSLCDLSAVTGSKVAGR